MFSKTRRAKEKKLLIVPQIGWKWPFFYVKLNQINWWGLPPSCSAAPRSVHLQPANEASPLHGELMPIKGFNQAAVATGQSPALEGRG